MWNIIMYWECFILTVYELLSKLLASPSISPIVVFYIIPYCYNPLLGVETIAHIIKTGAFEGCKGFRA